MTQKAKRIGRKALQPMADREEAAAFATLGREFVRLIRDEDSKELVEYAAANKLAEWLYQHRLTDTERDYFNTRTGLVFECELPPDDPLRHARVEEAPSAELTDLDIPF